MSDLDITKIRQLDFTLLLVLQALLRHRRTTAAAEELGLSPSAISHALKRLRHLFGEELFLRRPHGLEPTRHALSLAPRVDALLNDAANALGMAARFNPCTTSRGFLIAVPDHVAMLLAAPLLAAFEKEATGARFALRSLLGEDALESLRRNRIDAAIGQFQYPTGLRTEALYNDRYVVVARKHHPAIGKRGVNRTLFERLPHVMISVGGDFRAFTDEQFRAQGSKRRIIATVPRFAAAFEVVRQTHAVAVAPERLARSQRDLAIYSLPISLAAIRVLMVRRPQPDPGLDWLATRIRASVLRSGSNR